MLTLPADDNEHVALTAEQREAQRYAYQLADTHRRIANLLSVCPVEEQTIEEGQALLATLSGIVRARQGDGALRVAVTITYPTLGDRTTVWEVSPRASQTDVQ